jgi:hypothetical protein
MSASHDDGRMNYFLLLTPDEQRAAIHRMHRAGMGDYTLAAATGLSVEMIRRILGPTEPADRK